MIVPFDSLLQMSSFFFCFKDNSTPITLFYIVFANLDFNLVKTRAKVVDSTAALCYHSDTL